MNEKEFPYIIECAVCGNGLLRAYRCNCCQSVVAICDECELMWSDVESVFLDPQKKASGAFPNCCHCQSDVRAWQKLSFDGMAELGLEPFITDMSE